MGILNIPIFANGYIFKIYPKNGNIPKKNQWNQRGGTRPGVTPDLTLSTS